MGASRVTLPLPLTRLNPWFPGQFGISGTSNKTGLRTTVEGAVFYVDPNAVGVSDARDGTDTEAPLATITAALSKCQPYRGDTILVMTNAQYEYADPSSDYILPLAETVVVDVPGVRIIGVAPHSSVGVPWFAANVGDITLTIRAADVLVEGFMFCGAWNPPFVGAADGISIIWNGATAFGDVVTVRNCYFDGNGGSTIGTAVQLEFAYHCEIYDNVFDACENGIYTDIADSSSQYCKFWGNSFNECGATGASGAINCEDLLESEIFNNTFYNGGAVGANASVDIFIHLSNGGGNLVHHNTMSCLLPAAANGDYNDCNTASATDAWVQNYCMNGPAVTKPT
jgi:hypothetical protein